MSHDDQDYFLPLEDQRVFGAGIRRKRVPFIRSSEHELNTTDSSASTTGAASTQPGPSIANTYLSIVLPKSEPRSTTTTTAEPNQHQYQPRYRRRRRIAKSATFLFLFGPAQQKRHCITQMIIIIPPLAPTKPPSPTNSASPTPIPPLTSTAPATACATSPPTDGTPTVE